MSVSRSSVHPFISWTQVVFAITHNASDFIKVLSVPWRGRRFRCSLKRMQRLTLLLPPHHRWDLHTFNDFYSFMAAETKRLIWIFKLKRVANDQCCPPPSKRYQTTRFLSLFNVLWLQWSPERRGSGRELQAGSQTHFWTWVTCVNGLAMQRLTHIKFDESGCN